MLGTALTLGGIGKAMDFGFDLLGGYLGGQMSTANSKELLKKQFKYQKELMRIQNDYNVYNYQHQHQWRVGDLRNAGLNPILSASGGTAVAPVSNPGVSSGNSSNSLSRDSGMSNIVRDIISLNSAKVASEIEYNKASALERATAASLNSANAKKLSLLAKLIRITVPAMSVPVMLSSGLVIVWVMRCLIALGDLIVRGLRMIRVELICIVSIRCLMILSVKLLILSEVTNEKKTYECRS